MTHDKNINYNSYWNIITEHTGYDFSGYSLESLNRRLEKFISAESIGSADELNSIFNSDTTLQSKIMEKLLVSYTEMYRDPSFFQSLRTQALPYLSTYQKIKIWHAGCSTGEEVYSLAILLGELNLLDRCEIYASDICVTNLKKASAGVFSLSQMKESNHRYFSAGGKKNLSNYYTVYYDHVVFHKHLRNHIHFISHDMVEESPFSKFHLILCRNVFIYFNSRLQSKVLNSFVSNLYNYGYLGMGAQEGFVDIRDNNLSVIDLENKIYRKII